MSKQRAKGTKWETQLLPTLRNLFGPQVERAPLKGIHDAGDFLGVPWVHEAKSQLTPRFLEWARVCKKKHVDWVVLYHGDMRKGDGPYVLMPLHLYERLVATNGH